MASVADQYRSNAASFTARVEVVPGDRWENPSPCADWKARDVVRHVVDSSALFLGFIDRKLPPAPSVDDDPLAAWLSARDAIQAALDDPSTANQTYQGIFGEMTFEAGVAQFLSPDLVVHTWDLARAVGGDEKLDPASIADAQAQWKTLPEDAMRSSGAFGPAVEVPPDADAQTKFLAWAGRDPR